MDEHAREPYEFRVTVPVRGIPKWPHRAEMWRDRWPRSQLFLSEPAWMREEHVQRERVESHAARVREAGYLYVVDLDGARCRFGPRTMTLVGRIEAAHVEAAVGTVLAIVRWSLWMIYADNQAEYPGGPNRPLPGVTLSVRATPRRNHRPASQRTAGE